MGKTRPRDEGIALARLHGAAQRLARDEYDFDEPYGDPIGALHRISADPRLLGLAAGLLLADADYYPKAAVELLYRAGADLLVAEQRAAEIRQRIRR